MAKSKGEKSKTREDRSYELPFESFENGNYQPIIPTIFGYTNPLVLQLEEFEAQEALLECQASLKRGRRNLDNIYSSSG